MQKSVYKIIQENVLYWQLLLNALNASRRRELTANMKLFLAFIFYLPLP